MNERKNSCQELYCESEDLQASRLSVLSKNSQIDQHLNQDQKSPHGNEAGNFEAEGEVEDYASGS